VQAGIFLASARFRLTNLPFKMSEFKLLERESQIQPLGPRSPPQVPYGQIPSQSYCRTYKTGKDGNGSLREG